METFAPDGGPTAAWGIAGRGPGYVTRPEGVAIDAGGTVHVADTLDDRIERLGLDGAYLGQTGYISANSGYAAPAAGNGQFNTPGGVAVDRAAGRVWVADTANSRVQALGLDGTWQSTATGFNAPREIAVAPDGAVHVADTGNGRVQRRDPGTGAWTTLVAGLSSPAGVAATSDAVYVADTGANRVLRVAGATPTPLPAPPGGLQRPTGLAAAAGAVYVSDTAGDRVLRFNEAAGTWDVLGEGGTGAGQFIAPHGLALDAGATTLVVADTGNDRLQRITLSGTPRAALARLGVATAGTGRARDERAGRDLVPDRLPPGLQLGRRRAPAAGAREPLDVRRLVGRLLGHRPVRRRDGRRPGGHCGLRRDKHPGAAGARGPGADERAGAQRRRQRCATARRRACAASACGRGACARRPAAPPWPRSPPAPPCATRSPSAARSR